MNNRRVAIAIITYNSAEKLPDCLTSLKQQNYPVELVDIIVVDNNSSDDSLEIVRQLMPQAKVIKNLVNVGFARANNQAYELAQESNRDYLVLLNDDTIVESNWLLRLIETAESDSHVAAVQAKLLLYPEKELINSYGNALTFLGFGYCNFYREADRTGESFEVPYPSGGAVAIKMPALEKLGLFDEQLFMYHEDADLGWRLRLLGYKILLEPQAIVLHKYSFAKASYKYYYMERNRLYVAGKNYRLATLILFLPVGLAMEVGLLFYALKNGWLKDKLSGYGWLINNFGRLLSQRRQIQKLRTVGDREILRLLVAKIEFQDIENPLLTNLVNPLMSVYFWLAKKVIIW